MVREERARFVALDRGASSLRPPWWERFPRPLETAALRVWGILPSFVRAPLVPLERLFGTHTSLGQTAFGPETVPGVAEVVQEGFEPVENHTGVAWVAALWPEEHRRSVVETRLEFDQTDSDGQLWLVRSPWQSLTLDETFDMVWRWVERDRPPFDKQLWQARVSEVLRWDESQALDWFRRANEA